MDNLVPRWRRGELPGILTSCKKGHDAGNPFFEKIEKIRIHNKRNLRLATLGIVGEVCEAPGIAFYISHSIVRHLETTEDEPAEENLF